MRLDRGLPAGGFVPGLLRRMNVALLPPVNIEPVALDFADVARDRRQLLADSMMAKIAATAGPFDAVVPEVILIAEDMRLPPARFNFAISEGRADVGARLVVISLARLWARDSDLVAARVARMAIKNVPRVLNYPGSGTCVFGFPRSLAELDAMAESYCEPDLSTLRVAGIAR